MTPSTYPWIEELGLHDTLDAIASSGRGVLFGHPAQARDLTRRVLSRVPRTSEDLEARRQILGVELPKRQREALAVGLESELIAFTLGDRDSLVCLRDLDRWTAIKSSADWAIAEERDLRDKVSVAGVVGALLALDNGVRARWVAAVALHFIGQFSAAAGLHQAVARDSVSESARFLAALNRLASLCQARQVGVLRAEVPDLELAIDASVDARYDWLMNVVVFGSEEQCEVAVQYVDRAETRELRRWSEMHNSKRSSGSDSIVLIRPGALQGSKGLRPHQSTLAGMLAEEGVL